MKRRKTAKPSNAATGDRRPSPKAKIAVSKARPAQTKQQQLIDLLSGTEGATLTELATALKWQTASVRGVMSGVLKKRLGLQLVSKRDQSGERRYMINEGASHE